MIKRAILFLSATMLIGCDEQPAEATVVKKPEVNLSADQVRDFKSAAKVFDALPTPIEMAEIIKRAKVIYDPKLLNDDKKISQYVTSMEKSLNLGIYFADLSFTTVFDHPQESKNYLIAAQKISTDLNINDVFNESTISRMEANQNKKDSLLQIISEAYLSTDNYLFENKMHSVAAAVMAGGWVEALYIATQLKTENNDLTLIREKIAEQKPSLDNLVKLLGDCKDADLAQIKTKLVSIQDMYSKMPVDSTITNAKRLIMSEDDFAKLKLTMLNIRTSIVH